MNHPVTTALPRQRPRSLAQQVMEDLSGKIRSGVYQPGSRLPPEPEVMAEQGVSRSVVREAISRLQAAGLVETRHGVGTFVLAPVAPVLDIATALTLRDLIAMLELRISLETEAASLAAVRRSETQVRQMERALVAFEASAKKGESAVDADFDFHLQIALATGNKYFEDIYRHLGRTTIPRARLDTAQFAAKSGANYLTQTNREHRAILDAIARKDADAARAHMRTHLSNSRDRLKNASEAAEKQAAARNRSVGKRKRG